MLLAYVDPGLGALLWQTAVAGFVGFLFYLKKTRRWIGGVFLKRFRPGQKPPGVVVEMSASEKAEVKSDAP